MAVSPQFLTSLRPLDYIHVIRIRTTVFDSVDFILCLQNPELNTNIKSKLWFCCVLQAWKVH